MISDAPSPASQAEAIWTMPIVPEHYDRGPFTDEERWALTQIGKRQLAPSSAQWKAAQKRLARLDQPIFDVFQLRHGNSNPEGVNEVYRVMRQEMYDRDKIFWDWSPVEWKEVLGPTYAAFAAKWGEQLAQVRTTLMDMAYFLGNMSDLGVDEMSRYVANSANVYFGTELMNQQCQHLSDALQGFGYGQGKVNLQRIRHALSLLFIRKRSPYLEDISEALLADLGAEDRSLHLASFRIALGLQQLGILAPQPARSASPSSPFNPSPHFDVSGMAPEWSAWCLAWYEQAVDLTPRTRQAYAWHLLRVGRWLHQHAPQVRTPGQWTEDLALRVRADLFSWKVGQYGSHVGQDLLKRREIFGQPLGAGGISHYYAVLSRFFSDLTRHAYAVNGEPARRIKLDFNLKEGFALPDHLRRERESADPRDIDLRAWAKLTIAAATLSQNDLPSHARYPLSLYRALGLLWVTSARRPNELIRLRLDCVREDWEPEMLDDQGFPLKQNTLAPSDKSDSPKTTNQGTTKLCYLYIPAGKSRGPFWIWIPDYVADAIALWKKERPSHQDKLLDEKDRVRVSYLFCYRNHVVSRNFINRALIPILCKKAGVNQEDARGRITGHRGRSTRLTLLRRNGVGLDDLAEYAGHADSRTIRRYARQNPLQLHRIIQDADDVSRVIEGVVDLQAAAQGLPAIRWFIGYDADGEPMYCANQLYITCPHRLDCERCGMFIGGEKARLLQQGEQTLPVSSKVPMTPLEKSVVKGDQEGAEACRAALRQIPAPETTDVHLIFNPEGLSNHELEQLATLATTEATGILRQALAVHEKKLTEVRQHYKTGRNALVSAQKKKVEFIQSLITGSEQRRDGRNGC